MKITLLEEDKALLEWTTKYLQYKGYNVNGIMVNPVHVNDLSDVCTCSVDNVCADALLLGTRTVTQETIQSLISQEAKGCLLPRIKKGIVGKVFCSEVLQNIQQQGYSVIKKPFKLAEISEWLETCR